MRSYIKYFFLLVIIGSGINRINAKYPPGYDDPRQRKLDSKNVRFGYRADCAASRSETDMSINNVRARLCLVGFVSGQVYRTQGRSGIRIG